MTDNEIIKALECCASETAGCTDCPRFPSLWGCSRHNMRDALDLINRQKAEIERLEYTLLGVMHSVDKWLDGDELKQNEVDRAATMREKTLQIVESKTAEIERLKRLLEQEEKATNSLAKKCYKDGATEFAKMLCEGRVSNDPVVIVTKSLVKELTEGKTNE